MHFLVASSQLKEGNEQRVEAVQADPHLGEQHAHQEGHNGSLEVPWTRPYSLKIRNATGCSAGMYRCTLQELPGLRNLSGIVLLKVTGEATPVFSAGTFCRASNQTFSLGSRSVALDPIWAKFCYKKMVSLFLCMAYPVPFI